MSVHRTDGEISAKCDFEGANFLALNFANDIITGKKTFPYIKSFQFSVSKGGTGFTDKKAVSMELLEKIMKAKMKRKMEIKEKM